MVRKFRNHKKGFLKCVNNKRKTAENVGPLLSDLGALVAEDNKKVEVLNALHASVFHAKALKLLEIRERVWRKLPLSQEDLARDCLGKLNILKSTDPNWMQSQMLRELPELTAKAFPIIF